jgi:lactate dehydrogenase-like 2-hydroxyacid dehydrogenase
MTRPDVLMMGPMIPSVVEKLEADYTVHRLWEAGDKDAFLREHGPKIRAITMSVSHTKVDGPLFDRMPNLEIVACFGVGYDQVDASEAARRGIMVTNTPDVLNDEVADTTIGLLIATLRQLPQAERYLRAGKWLERPFPLSPTLRGRKIGIVGLGRIGRAIGKRLEGFGVDIGYHSRSEKKDTHYRYYPTLLGVAEASDVLILITPGGAETRHMVNADVLKALGPEGVLINVARGSVVDERALIAALQDGTILSAGLDVYEHEPKVPQELIDMEHVVLLPHVASASLHTRNGMGKMVTDNLAAWFAGKPPISPVAETPAEAA